MLPTIFNSFARCNACTRLLTLSFLYTFLICDFTVSSVMYRRSAIALLDNPLVINVNILVSCSVSNSLDSSSSAYNSFLQAGKIEDLGDEANLEKITALNPDVIIAWEGDEKIYDQLSKIAKTVLIPQSENWQDTIVKITAVIGEETKAQEYIAAYNTKLKTLAPKMTGEKGKTAIFMMTWGN